MTENTDMGKKADKKYPEIVIKLSMIHCASRDGWKEEDGIKISLHGIGRFRECHKGSGNIQREFYPCL
jgi:hypothetical protein